MTLLDELKNSFKIWYQKIKLSLGNLSYSDQLLSLPSDNIDDYYYDDLNQTWIYKEKITQVGFENILNLTKVSIDSMEANIENLTAIISNINTISIDTTNLQAIISDISTMQVNVNNLQAVIANISSMTVDSTNLQAIISDINDMNINVNNLQAIIAHIDTVNTNIGNLQAIITDIANIETLNTTISGNITSLTAIIANINTMNTNITNLQAIITDIANIETLNTTISGNIGTMNTNVDNLQAIITDIANIETLNTTISGNITSLTAIIANIGTMNTNIANLQAIITDIANIETLNTTISGNITSLTAIIANIGTMNTNIANLQAIISDIANIETQNISMSTALATINTNIGTINTAITSINAHEADIDINIGIVKDLDVEINAKYREGVSFSKTIPPFQNQTFLVISGNYIYNSLKVQYDSELLIHGTIELRTNKPSGGTIDVETFNIDQVSVPYEKSETFYFETLLNYIELKITNNGASTLYIDGIVFFSKKTLASELNLNDLNEKNHASLTNVLPNQHHSEGYSKAEVDAFFMIGVENAQYINCTRDLQYTPDAMKGYISWANRGSVDMDFTIMLPIPSKLGALNLYINDLKIGIFDSDANDYVDNITIYRWNSYNNFEGIASFDHNIVHGTGTGDFTHAIDPAEIVNEKILIRIICVNTSYAELDIDYIKLKCYYA